MSGKNQQNGQEGLGSLVSGSEVSGTAYLGSVAYNICSDGLFRVEGPNGRDDPLCGLLPASNKPGFFYDGSGVFYTLEDTMISAVGEIEQ